MLPQADFFLRVRWITGEFNLSKLFTNTIMPGNTRHNLVESIFWNTASPIVGIKKAWANLYMGAFTYLPHYKSSRGKWVLGDGYQFAEAR